MPTAPLAAAGKPRRKIELKATSRPFARPSNLIENLVFNSELERELFEKGETDILRVFLGEEPVRIFVVTNKILGLGAQLTSEARYVLRGEINYQDAYTELVCSV
jgi:hypothetical protein